MNLESIELSSGDVIRASSARPSTMNTNITLRSVESDGDLLRVAFEYLAVYSPDSSHLRIGGRAVFRSPDAEKAAAAWSRTGVISGEDGEAILNSINYHASVNAILLAKAFDMVPPVVLPRLAIAGKPKAKAEPKIR